MKPTSKTILLHLTIDPTNRAYLIARAQRRMLAHQLRWARLLKSKQRLQKIGD